MTYSVQRIKEMGGVQLWTELGLHKGYLGEEVKKTLSREYQLRYFHLGQSDVVGVDDTYSRRALPAINFSNQPWFDSLVIDGGAWKGPEICASQGAVSGNRLRALALPVLKLLQSGAPLSTKPRPKMKLKRKGVIAYADRPDVGRTLLFHDDSDGYHIETDPAMVEASLMGGCDDVTDIPHHEAAYLKQQSKPKLKLKEKPKFNIRRRA